jgi:hypothetical protein
MMAGIHQRASDPSSAAFDLTSGSPALNLPPVRAGSWTPEYGGRFVLFGAQYAFTDQLRDPPPKISADLDNEPCTPQVARLANAARRLTCYLQPKAKKAVAYRVARILLG